MDPRYQYSQYGTPPLAATETSWTAIAALFLAVIAIIVIVVVVWFVNRNQTVVTTKLTEWAVVTGASTSGSFNGNPNTVFVAPAVSSNYNLAITPYTDIANYVSATAISPTTTFFRIDNTLNTGTATSVKLTTTPPQQGGTANPDTIPPGAVYEYHWLSTTQYKLISWSKP